MTLWNKKELYLYMLMVGLVVLALTIDMERGSEWSYYYSWLYVLPMCLTTIGLLIVEYVVKRVLDRGNGYVVTGREATKYGVLMFTGFWLYEFTSVISMSINSIDGGMRVYFTEGYFEYTTLMYGLMYVVVVGLIMLMLSMLETAAYFTKKRSKSNEDVD